MSQSGSRPWFASFRARLTRPPVSQAARIDGLEAPTPLDLSECLRLEDTTSRWLRTTQGAELG